MTKLLIKKFKAIQKNLVSELSAASSARKYLNICYILLRYGKFQNIINANPLDSFNKNELYEFQLLVQVAHINLSLSRSESVDLTGLLTLAQGVMTHIDLSDRTRVLILNRFVVCAYRYSQNTAWRTEASQMGKELEKIIAGKKLEVFSDFILASVAYRGLAMIQEWGKDKAQELMTEMRRLALLARPHTEIEKITNFENLYTGLQTISKWSVSQGDKIAAEKALLEMTQIDPMDSTAFSELGFFYFKNGLLEKSKEAFEAAEQLGPPAVGMNLYYKAKILQEQKKWNEAVIAFERAADVDPYAVSPWLDLIECQMQLGAKTKAQNAATHILKTTELNEQLEDSERQQIEALYV